MQSPRSSSLSTTSPGGSEEEVNEGEVLKGRQFVYKELMATEHDYINDLKTVIDVST